MKAPQSLKVNRLRTIEERGHREFDEHVRVSGRIVVGGDLTVLGDLHCTGPLFCLGSLVVKGNLSCEDVLLVGGGVEVGGDLNGQDLRIEGGYNSEEEIDEFADYILSHMPKRSRGDEFESARSLLADEEVILALSMDRQFGDALQVGGDCICEAVAANGHIQVGGYFNPDDVDSLGSPISARSMAVEGDMTCGSLHAVREISIQGNLFCVVAECMRLEVWGAATAELAITVTGPDWCEDGAAHLQREGPDHLNVFVPEPDSRDAVAIDEKGASLQCGSIRSGSVSSAGSIRADGDIVVERYLKANGSIITRGSISTGKRYGVMAGLDVARDLWFDKGYVCAPAKPSRILTGVYRELARRRAGGESRPKKKR